MKKIVYFLFAFILLIFGQVKGQNNQQTEICIIANPHSNTKYYNSNVLDSILNKINPDLILVELDSSFFTSDFNYDTVKYSSLSITKSKSPNIIGTTLYKKHHKKVQIRPFDITGRNDSLKKNNYFDLKDKMYYDIYKYEKDDTISERNYRDYILLAKSLYAINSLNIETLKQMNSNVLTNLMFLQQSVYLNSALNIAETTDSLLKYKSFAHWQSDFWERRNNKMVENILYFIRKNQYERIVVLTGNMHKFYILYGLKKEKKDSDKYLIKEFWDY